MALSADVTVRTVNGPASVGHAVRQAIADVDCSLLMTIRVRRPTRWPPRSTPSGSRRPDLNHRHLLVELLDQGRRCRRLFRQHRARKRHRLTFLLFLFMVVLRANAGCVISRRYQRVNLIGPPSVAAYRLPRSLSETPRLRDRYFTQTDAQRQTDDDNRIALGRSCSTSLLVHRNGERDCGLERRHRGAQAISQCPHHACGVAGVQNQLF